MALKQKRKVINGKVYLVTQMDAITALKTQVKLFKIIGPQLSNILKGGVTDVKQLLLSGKLIDLISSLFENFDDEFVSNFVISLFANGVFVEEVKQGVKVPTVVDFETYYTGETLPEAWQVAYFILEANFNLGELGTLSGSTTNQAAVEGEQKS